MAENKILPWAQTGTANVLSDTDYAADVASGGLYGDGVKTGQASSQQANKTWRQATAPGSGLGQFLVDNLNVDVTDADTPATFSTRIANAVLKLAQISPFNQSWATATGGYRKYAIVSDSSGNFWVSTADQNTTVPGANGAMWQSLFNGYLHTIAPNPSVGDVPLQNLYYAGGVSHVWAAVNASTYGSLAWLTDVASEATARANADTTLQTNINNEATARAAADASLNSSKANLAGGNSFTGQQVSSGNVITNKGAAFETYDQKGGQASAVFGAYDPGTGNDNVEAYFNIVNSTRTQIQQFTLLGSGRIASSLGMVAFVSQLPTAGTITNGTYTKVPLNDGSGKSVLTQNFKATVSNDSVVAFPMSFSGSVDSIGIKMTVAGNADADHFTKNVTTSQFAVGIWGSATNVPFDITATGIV